MQVRQKRRQRRQRNVPAFHFPGTRLLTELEPYRQVDIHYDGPKFLKKPNHKKNWDGERTEKYLYQMRQWEGENWIFIANGKPLGNPDLVLSDKVKIALTGTYRVELWNHPYRRKTGTGNARI